MVSVLEIVSLFEGDVIANVMKFDVSVVNELSAEEDEIPWLFFDVTLKWYVVAGLRLVNRIVWFVVTVESLAELP
jgi:hypothetical protein